MDRSAVRNIWKFLNRRPIVTISAPLIIGLGVQTAFKSGSEWTRVFVAATHILRSGGDIYGSIGYAYPPVLALVAVPFGSLPVVASQLAWFAVNVACIVGLVRSAWMLAGGSILGPIGPRTRREWEIAGAGVLCSAAYILNALAHQQVDVIIDFLVVSGCLLLVRGNRIGGAVLIGLAAACKGPPLLFAAYLAFRRNWLAAGLVVVVAVGVNLLPDLVIAPPDGQPRLMVWLQRFVIPTFTGQVGSWNGVSSYNQSLAGTVQRIYTTTLQSTPSGLIEVNAIRRVPATLIKLSAYGLMLALLIASIMAALRGETLARLRTGVPRFPSQTALELSAMSLLALLMSPMTDLAHLGLLIFPAFCLARIAVCNGDRIIGTTLVVAAAGALAVNKDLVGDAIYTSVLWFGAATLSMLALWIGCVTALARGQGEPPIAGFTNSIFSFLRHRSPVHA